MTDAAEWVMALKCSEHQGLEVLGNCGGENEPAVARAGKTSQPHTLEAVVDLQVGKAHLDAFALVARLKERFCPHQPACQKSRAYS